MREDVPGFNSAYRLTSDIAPTRQLGPLCAKRTFREQDGSPGGQVFRFNKIRPQFQQGLVHSDGDKFARLA
jgi:hypothetical protein